MTATTAPAPSVTGDGRSMSFRRGTQYADAFFLMAVGGVQVVLELAGHFWGAGPLGAMLHDSSYTIGFVEAHGLAVVLGAVLLVAARRAQSSGHVLGLALHSLLGAANLTFWSSYAAFGIVPAGVASTAAHLLFVLAHALCLVVLHRRTRGYPADTR